LLFADILGLLATAEKGRQHERISFLLHTSKKEWNLALKVPRHCL